MSALVEAIREYPQIFHSSRSKMVRVWEAEDKLGITFPEAYQEYLCHFGAIGFRDIEWTGLNVEAELNVVRATLGARAADPNFPPDCFVLRIDDGNGGMVLCDGAERIYTWRGVPGGRRPALLCEGLEPYFRQCLREV